MKHQDAIRRGAVTGLLIAMGIAFCAGLIFSSDHDPWVALEAAFVPALVMGTIWWRRWFYTRFL